MNNAISAIATFDEARKAQRTHLFVAATLHSGATLTQVNIRNMSPTGALIEAPGIPDVGESVVLKRGGLKIAGRVAWTAGRKAGVAFASTICVADWMSRQAGGGQERVDRIVADFKAGSPLGGPALDVDLGRSGVSLAAELDTLRTELALLGESLISDPALLANHPEIQTLDIALQRVDRIIGGLGKEN